MTTTSSTPDTIGATLRQGFALIGRLVREHRVSFALALTGALLYASAIVGAAFVVGWITETVMVPVLDEGADLGNKLVAAVAAVLGVAFWKATGIVIRRTAAGWLQYRSQADMRARLIDHQMRLELGWFRRRNTGDLLSVSETDARGATFVLAPLPWGTAASLLMVATVGLMFWLDWALGLVALVSVVTIGSLDLSGSWKMFGAYGEVQRMRGVVSGVAHESFDGALTVKALGRQTYETERFEIASQQLRDGVIGINRTWATYRAIVDALVPATIVVMLSVGALRISTGNLSTGELVTAAYLFSLLSVPMRLIGYILWDLSESLAAWRRVEVVLIADEFVSHGSLTAADSVEGAGVEGDEVLFGYDAEPILHGVRFDIPPGRTVAIVGPTASGKSTLAMLIARLWDPSSGHIMLDGRDLRDFARSELPGEVAFVSQDTFLFDDSVEGNIALGRPFSSDAVTAAAKLAAADRFISQLPNGYGTLLGERGTTLSGGQRQRIALARALVRRPRLLILDDATSAVDPSVEVEILQSLRREELPSTVVVVAYRPSSIVLADEIAYMEDGKMVAYGSHEALLRSTPGYATLLQAYEKDAAERIAADAALEEGHES